MLSELALIDWVALLIALILLGVAAVATYLSHQSAGPSLFGSPAESLGFSPTSTEPKRHERASQPPAHALSSTIDGSVASGGLPDTAPPIPAHALAGEANHAADSKDEEASESSAKVVLPDAPAPPILVRSTPTEDVIDMTDHRGETVAERAERLRNRPVSEPEAQQARANAEAPGLLFANATNKLSAGMATAEGFPARQPGFFDDPMGRHELRYWNGHSWTEYVKEDGDRFIDPL